MNFTETFYANENQNITPSPDDRPYDRYDDFEYGIRKSFETALSLNEPLFTTSAENLYDIFLANIPEEGRQCYNCNACRYFVDRFGGIVTITDGGFLLPVMWNFKCPKFFEKAFYAVRDIVISSKVTGVFVPETKKLGTPRTGVWTHMHVEVPKKIVYKNKLKTAYQFTSEKKEDFKMLMRALQTYKQSTIETAVNILRADDLYRGEKTLGVAKWFLDIRLLAGSLNRTYANVVWKKVATAPEGFCHISSSMIGTLLDDIEDGLEYEEIKRRFEEKMNPTKYQRPQAAPSLGNVKRAEEIIAKLGLENSLKRRFARLDEIPLIWRPYITTSNDTATGVFTGVKTKESMRTKQSTIIPKASRAMTWEKFRRTVLPYAKKIELHANFRDSYSAIVTAVDPSAPPIILWDSEERRNPFSWYMYSGGSYASHWGITNGTFVEVTGITSQPNMWFMSEGDFSISNGVFFILKGCKDTVNKSLGLFPEILRRELREVRATIEAYSKMNKLEGADEASACGLCLQDSNSKWNCILRVTTDVGVSEYTLDRWD